VSQKLSHEAVEWFVLNESGRAGDAEFAQRWVEWFAEPAHRAEYGSILELVQDLRKLAPPVQASRTELTTDVAARKEDPSMSLTG
jgi:ferric-dicitrate binding protein FerR (iron transport regulator)